MFTGLDFEIKAIGNISLKRLPKTKKLSFQQANSARMPLLPAKKVKSTFRNNN
jgi:hypothetical protein